MFDYPFRRTARFALDHPGRGQPGGPGSALDPSFRHQSGWPIPYWARRLLAGTPPSGAKRACWQGSYGQQGACNCQRLESLLAVVEQDEPNGHLLPVSEPDCALLLGSPFGDSLGQPACADAGTRQTACNTTISKRCSNLLRRTFSRSSWRADRNAARLNPPLAPAA